VSFTATISGSASAPTGTVQFKTNGVAFGSAVTLSSGVASSAATATFPRGTNTVTAEYSGSTIYFSSTNTLNQVVTNTPPVAGTDSYSRANNLQLKIHIDNLLTNDTDADGDPITLAGINLTSTNGATITTNGTFIFYTNSVATNVNDQLSYTISDGQGGTTTGLVNITVSGGQSGQTNALVSLTNDVATVTFFGVPGTAYQAQRATNVNFTGTIRSWSTNAPSGGAFGVFQVSDDFSDVGGPPAPSQSYYRLLVP
jgi:hypothetical protein